MTRTISTNYLNTGLTLTNTTYSPVYIAPGVSITNPTGAALINDTVFYWAVTNQSNAVISGYSFGISLNGAGTVANRGTIEASYTNGPGFSYDGTTHVLIAKSAGLYVGGGGVSNSQSGVIDGGIIGLALGSAGTVVNAGSIGVTGTNVGFAVVLAEGGVVTNATDGSIVGGRYGVLTDGGASVTNQSGATITGSLRGVFAVNGADTVTNEGGISGSTTGIGLFTGGIVRNATNASVEGANYGIVIQYGSGAVTNSGTIIGSNYTGVDLFSGGYVGNLPGGTITGGYYGVRLTGAPGTVENQASISGTLVSGIFMIYGGAVTNQTGATIVGGDGGVIAVQTAATVTNQGSIQQLTPYNGQTFAIGGVLLLGGGSLNNSGQIIGASYGVDIATTAGAVTNTGVIVNTREGGGAGVILVDGGSVTNGIASTIASGGYSVLVVNDAGTVTNDGLIASYVTGGAAAVAIQTGGSVTNQSGGLITSEFIGVQLGVFEETSAAAAGTVVNQGTISASDNEGDGAAVWLHGPATVINQANAVIEGGTNGKIVGGPLNTYSSGPFGVVAYYQTTLVNYGSIGGGIYSSALYHQGIQGPKQFAFDASNKLATNTISNLIKMAPGASFGGVVLGADGDGSSTLELMSGASAGTIRSLGTVTIDGIYYEGYRGFGIVQLDPGARWTLGGTVASGTIISLGTGGTNVLTLANPAKMQGTITGFVMGDTIGAEGITVTGSVYAGGVLTLTDTTGTIALDLPGSFATSEFLVTNGGGNAEISILPRTLSWTGANDTAFGTAANWNDLTDGLNPAQTAPDPIDTVEFNTSNGGVIGTGTVAALDVGLGGSGILQLSNATTIVTGSFDAGVGESDVGQIGISGTGTDLSVTGNATLADDGTGVMSVLSGATVAAANLTIGRQGDSSGAMVVSDDGTVVNIAGDLNVGTALGTGDLTIGPGATVNASVVNLQGEVVLENGDLDPTVNLINQGQTAGGSGTIAAGDIVDEGVIQAGGSKPSQKLLVVAGTVLGGGPWTINGTAQPQANGDVGILQINAGGTLELTGPVLNAGSTTFTDDVTPQSTYTVTDSVVDVNFEDATGVLKIDDIGGFAGTIVAFRKGDSFVITGGTLSNLGVTGGNTLTVSDSGNGGTDQIIFGSEISTSGFTIASGNTIQVACFAAGTRIATEADLVAVESLRVGDRVITEAGACEPIVWIGQRTVNCRAHPKPKSVWPVRVARGAFGRNVPLRDLYLSPDHAVLVDGVLIPVKLLVNGAGIVQVRRSAVTYFHIELPVHAVILAEGLAAESYLDLGDRADFASESEPIRLFRDFAARLAPDAALAWEAKGAAPLVIAGEKLQAIRVRLRDRARPIRQDAENRKFY